MKFLILILLISSVHSYKFLRLFMDPNSRPFVKVFKDVINELYLRENIPFDIVTIGNDTELTIDLFHNIKHAMQNSSMSIKHYKNFSLAMNRTKYNLAFHQSAIIMGITDRIYDFNLRTHLMNEYPKELRFLTFRTNPRNIVPSKNSTKYSIKSNNILLYEYFLCPNKSKKYKIDFLTFEWFTPNSCNKIKIRIINTFDFESQKWEKPFSRIEKKFRNFHGCKIIAKQSYYSFMDESNKIRGYAFDILDTVGSKANFTVFRHIGPNLKNIKFAPQIKCEVGICIYKRDHLTTTFEDQKYTMMITKGEKYGSYDKLFLPFDVPTWYLLLLTFGVAFEVIFVIDHMSKQLQKLLYDGVYFPAFNVIGSFFGIAQCRLPISNFLRIILMHFILFCLIIRTAYQEVFFEMMAADMRKHVPITIEGLLKENYVIYGVEDHIEFQFFQHTIIE